MNKKKATSYTPEKRKELLGKYNSLRKQGETAAAAAKATGVPYITLRTWEKKTTGKGSKVPTAKAGRKKVGKRGRPKAKQTAPRFKGRVRITLKDGTVIACETPADAATVLSSL